MFTWIANLLSPRPAPEVPCRRCDLLRHQNRALERELLNAQQERGRLAERLRLTEAEAQRLDARLSLSEASTQAPAALLADEFVELARRVRALDICEHAQDVPGVVAALERVREQLAVVAPVLRASEEAA